jgi:predicted HicB family RNase H-like nuclease
MARPKRTGDRVATAVRFPKELHERALEAAHDRDTSINHLVVKALDFYLDRLPPLEMAEGSKKS